jgi:hypothetical protein
MFRLEIDTDNDAFYPWTTEVARLLRLAADRIDRSGDCEGYLRDVNGNSVGCWSIDPVDAEVSDE